MIQGFSKLSKEDKIKLLDNCSKQDQELLLNENNVFLEKLTENVVSSFKLPLSIAPNCKINDIDYFIPMVTEESSVVAACSNAFKFISNNGGFKSKIISDIKKGNIYIDYSIDVFNKIQEINPLNEEALTILDANMKKRNAGLVSYNYEKLDEFIKVSLFFNTAESMGANYINTVLEKFSEILKNRIPDINIIMSILSNNYNQSIVESYFKIKKENLSFTKLPFVLFFEKFKKAVKIAQIDIDRATTHNKGFMNGVDAVLLATGQDYRAMNSAIHSFASKNGQYSSLSFIEEDSDHLVFKTQIPYSLGVVGGITNIHPMVKVNQKIISKTIDTKTLAMIIASTGLAQNFAAISALISDGIQKGHMKMHLDNILMQLQASESECLKIKKLIDSEHISYKKVEMLLKDIRNSNLK
jgi:hydroxymethylglutaryl-CoA reductase